MLRKYNDIGVNILFKVCTRKSNKFDFDLVKLVNVNLGSSF